ncbi:SpoIIE family protein phosphatase [Streptomyces sp. ATE26]|uniref:SpoIIE family protein phosphatase n=1 Tax=Streptomyces sp. ATE26 TaxID=2954237 RepID=UPI002482BF30|nr:SpoIIE family protein phosphatase [Streptomyces sp. ATE26]MDI1454164.1 SpoIIE family protein phosphatase [Streptomyces sp. ATE26]
MPSDDRLMRLDEAGRVLEWHRAAQEAFGRSAEEAVGRTAVSLLREITAGGPAGRARPEAMRPLLVRPVLTDGTLEWEVSATAEAASGEDLAILRAMFAHSPVGLHVLDDRLRIVRVNTATRTLRGTAVDRLPGRVFSRAYGLADPAQEEAAARRVLETGRAELNRIVRVTPGAAGGEHRIYSVSYVRLENAGGDVLGLVASAVDVTEREHALWRLSVVDEVRRRVGGRLDVLSTCQEFVDAVVPRFSGIAVVEVVEEVVRGEAPPVVPVGREVPLRRAAFRGVVSAYPLGEVRRLPYGTPFSRVLTDLRPRLVRVAEDSLWLAADPPRADAIRASGAHSLIVAPLALRGAALGVASFYRHRDEEPFQDADVALAADVCAHAALCIDNARRYARERTIAATVQRRLLPQRPPAQATVEPAHLHLPAPEGGGAWFDVIGMAGARTALVVGEVAGHGMAAATTMGQLRTVIQSLAALDLAPDELMARLSDTAARLAAERAALPAGDPLHREPLTASCLIAVYDPIDLTCTFVRAGLSEPVVVPPHGAPKVVPVPAGPLLAGPGNAPFPATTVDLPAGSTVAIGTRVVAQDVLAPSARLRALFDEHAHRPLPDLCDAIAYAVSDGRRTEDALLLLGRTSALPADRVFGCALPPGPEAGPFARAEARRRLREWGVDQEVAFTSELIVSELVGNAVRYGEPPMRLRLICNGMLTCEVSDSAMSAPHVQHARTSDETGRGLFIVAALADDWGIRYQAEGKTVWAQQSVDGCP